MSTPNKSIVPYIFDQHPVRAVLVDGEPWFVGTDVAGALGYTNSSKALNDHCKSLKRINYNEALGLGFADTSPNGMTLIPERDVYRLIMRSKLPSAQRFEVWVVDDVLPSIRKTGGYGVPAVPAFDPTALLNDPAAMRGLLLTYADKVLALQPKASAFDRIADAPGTMCVTDAAKALQLPPAAFVRWAVLPENRWLYRRADGRLAAHQGRIDEGFAVHKVWLRARRGGLPDGRPHPLITIDGLVALSLVDWRAVNWSALR